MLSKDVFLDAVKKECAVIKHLAGCVPAGAWDYRPTPPQRSTLELLRYLAIAPAGVATYVATGGWDHWDALEAKAKAMSAEQAAAAVAKQPAAVAKALGKLTDAKIAKATVKDFDGKSVPAALFLTRMVLGTLIAYRMQLFLYAKSAGNAGIGTSDCWMGKAAKPKPAEATTT